MKKLSLILLVFITVSCNVSDDEISFDHRNRYNQTVKIHNHTEKEYKADKIYFGALKEGKFYPTDSLITSSNIPPASTDGKDYYVVDVADLWIVKYEKAFDISNEATYRLRLENGQLIKYPYTYTSPNPMMGNYVDFVIDDKYFITE